MAINPNSTIHLCNVPIDNTYKHQIYFGSPSEQLNYFAQKVVKTFSEYLTVRKTLPGGQLESSVRVDANIDDLLLCNYMYYQNNNHGDKVFYAFITKVVYINEGTTEIYFETDVYQTWRFNVEFKASYVVREHSKTDNIGDNVTPEKFNFSDYTYDLIEKDTQLEKWGYLIASSEGFYESSWWEDLFSKDYVVNGYAQSGIYQGVYFYYFKSVDGVNDCLNKLLEKAEDSILFIACIPEFCLKSSKIVKLSEDGSGGVTSDEGIVLGSSSASFSSIYLEGGNFDPKKYGFSGVPVKNNKLYTAPFYKIVVSNNNGEQGEYGLEDFDSTSNISFIMRGDVSANPSVCIYPQNYKGQSDNYEAGLFLSGFPQCSFNTDTFKLWLAKNQFSMGASTLASLGQIAMGVGLSTSGAGAMVGAGMIASGASGIIGTVNSTHQALREPNKTQAGQGKNNLLTAIGRNRFYIYVQSVKADYAKTVDDFFTMYGYQTNKMKVPNFSSRPYYNYVETVDCNIVGSIPCDDMQKLKAMFNGGVTLWKPTATVGDYSVDNSPE